MPKIASGPTIGIPESLALAAEALNLDRKLDPPITGEPMCPGIGYLIRRIDHRDIVLSNDGDCGSPDSLESPAQLFISMNDEWTRGFEIHFNTAQEALRALASVEWYNVG